MAKKRKIGTYCLEDIFSQVCEFVECELKPSVYCDVDLHEKKLQKDVAKYLSEDKKGQSGHDVLREVVIPMLCKLRSSGDENWNIDESLLVKSVNGPDFYATGELKFHGKSMTDRPFIDQANDDVTRMLYVSRYYVDVPMGFSVFVTCDEKERNEVFSYADSQHPYKIKNITLQKEGYYAVAIMFLPTADEAPFGYAAYWNKHLTNLRKANKLKDNYFPCTSR